MKSEPVINPDILEWQYETVTSVHNSHSLILFFNGLSLRVNVVTRANFNHRTLSIIKVLSNWATLRPISI